MAFRADNQPRINQCFTSFSQLYEMQKKIRSSGDLYEIRQCKDINTSEMRAAKIYRKLELTDALYEFIKREIELLRRIDHPNIIKLHNVIEDEDRIYIIIDDIKGTNLFGHIIAKK